MKDDLDAIATKAWCFSHTHRNGSDFQSCFSMHLPSTDEIVLINNIIFDSHLNEHLNLIHEQAISYRQVINNESVWVFERTHFETEGTCFYSHVSADEPAHEHVHGLLDDYDHAEEDIKCYYIEIDKLTRAEIENKYLENNSTAKRKNNTKENSIGL